VTTEAWTLLILALYAIASLTIIATLRLGYDEQTRRADALDAKLRRIARAHDPRVYEQIAGRRP